MAKGCGICCNSRRDSKQSESWPCIWCPQTNNVQPLLAIRPVRDAMLRLDPSCSSFTSNHVLLSRLCLLARTYTLALPVIDKDLSFFPANTDQAYLQRSQTVLCGQHESSATFVTHSSGLSSKLSHRDHLQYFLYSGMIYMALKQWKKALHCLSIVISTPSVSAISTIMVEAYKKWLLVSLLERGYVYKSSYMFSQRLMIE